MNLREQRPKKQLGPFVHAGWSELGTPVHSVLPTFPRADLQKIISGTPARRGLFITHHLEDSFGVRIVISDTQRYQCYQDLLHASGMVLSVISG